MLVSSIDGRLRLRDGSLKDPRVAARAESLLQANSAVRSICCNPRTGSMLVEYDSRAAGEAMIMALLAKVIPVTRPTGKLYRLTGNVRGEVASMPPMVAEAA